MQKVVKGIDLINARQLHKHETTVLNSLFEK